MHEQLHLLVCLQDLDGLIKESQDVDRRAELENLGFSLDNLGPLRDAREKLAKRIDPRYLRVYERLSTKHGRAVVPVEGKTCLGCFQSVPPSFFSEITRNQPVKVCENCGRILYLLTD
jgi:predicted  nucleic acid-binding Zn-ribbon protein